MTEQPIFRQHPPAISIGDNEMTYRILLERYGSATALYDAILDTMSPDERLEAIAWVQITYLLAWAQSRNTPARDDVAKVVNTITQWWCIAGLPK